MTVASLFWYIKLYTNQCGKATLKSLASFCTSSIPFSIFCLSLFPFRFFTLNGPKWARSTKSNHYGWLNATLETKLDCTLHGWAFTRKCSFPRLWWVWLFSSTDWLLWTLKTTTQSMIFATWTKWAMRPYVPTAKKTVISSLCTRHVW